MPVPKADMCDQVGTRCLERYGPDVFEE